jgi:hypothetical protein
MNRAATSEDAEWPDHQSYALLQHQHRKHPTGTIIPAFCTSQFQSLSSHTSSALCKTPATNDTEHMPLRYPVQFVEDIGIVDSVGYKLSYVIISARVT